MCRSPHGEGRARVARRRARRAHRHVLHMRFSRGAREHRHMDHIAMLGASRVICLPHALFPFDSSLRERVSCAGAHGARRPPVSRGGANIDSLSAGDNDGGLTVAHARIELRAGQRRRQVDRHASNVGLFERAHARGDLCCEQLVSCARLARGASCEACAAVANVAKREGGGNLAAGGGFRAAATCRASKQ